jgi:hypothetical protein
MPSSHFIFIPGVLMVGVVIGWILGARAARDAYAAELKRRDERAARARMKVEKVEEVEKRRL